MSVVTNPASWWAVRSNLTKMGRANKASVYLSSCGFPVLLNLSTNFFPYVFCLQWITIVFNDEIFFVPNNGNNAVTFCVWTEVTDQRVDRMVVIIMSLFHHQSNDILSTNYWPIGYLGRLLATYWPTLGWYCQLTLDRDSADLSSYLSTNMLVNTPYKTQDAKSISKSAGQAKKAQSTLRLMSDHPWCMTKWSLMRGSHLWEKPTK